METLKVSDSEQLICMSTENKAPEVELAELEEVLTSN